MGESPPAWVSGATPEDRWDGYLQPGGVLRNLVGATTHVELRETEDEFVEWRMVQLRERPIVGRFDLDHLKAVHAHLFQDVYGWAGQLRTVDMSKGEDVFAEHDAIAPLLDTALGAGDRALPAGSSKAKVVPRLTTLCVQINYAHPFREGNGRTLRTYLSQLAEGAGWRVDWRRVHPQENVERSQAAHAGNFKPLIEMLDAITVPTTLTVPGRPDGRESPTVVAHPVVADPVSATTSTRAEHYRVRAQRRVAGPQQ